MDAEITISLNMLTLGTAKEAMDLHKSMFRAIFTNNSVGVLEIEMAGVLPALAGALGAVLVGEVIMRAYNGLAMRLESAATFKQGKSPYGRCRVNLSMQC